MGKPYFFEAGKFLPVMLLISAITFFTSSNALTANDYPTQSIVNEGHSHDDLKRGQRFFMGLLPQDITHNSCVSCHNLKPSEEFNWNPSAREVAKKYLSKDFESFKTVVLKASSGKMAEVHQNFKIEEEDLKLVKLYLDNLAVEPQGTEKPSINRLILFLFLGIVMAWALIELIFLRKIKYRFITVIILVGAFGWQVSILVDEGIKLGRQENYAPDQPVKFSHKVHAGENEIDCMYCHHTAEFSKSAGIPATNLCLNCHVLIREGTNSGKFEISKVIDANESGQSIDWIRIHNLPDHVFFSHAIHVGSGKLDCNACHGAVEEMDIMKQQNDLSMGWCVNCHRETEVDFMDNGYYDTYVKLHEDLKAGIIDTIVAQDIGANDCMKCHY